MSAMGVIELDMNRIELDENGVKNFCWPVELREFFSMRDVVAAGLVQVGRRANSKNTEVAGAFSVILHYFLLEAITAFVNYLLVRRAKNGNLKINPSNYSFIVSSFVENRTPDIPKLDVPAWLRQGPSPLSTLRAPIRFVRDLVVSNGIVRRKSADSAPGRRRRTQLAACGDTPRTPASVLTRNVAPRSLHEQAGHGVPRTRGDASVSLAAESQDRDAEGEEYA